MLKICSLWGSKKVDSDTISGILQVPVGAELMMGSENTIVVVFIPEADRRKDGPLADVYLGEKQQRVTR